MRGKMITLKPDDEVVFFYAIVKKADWAKTKLPEGSFGKAMDIGEASELCNMEHCRGWGAMAGISLAKLARRHFPVMFNMMNPPANGVPNPDAQ